MRATITIFNVLLLICCSGCQSGQNSPAAKPAITWTQWCECGVLHTYGYTFDDRDYTVIAGLAAALHLPARTYFEGPEGPSPAASATFAKDLSFDFLRHEMPALRKDTFQSFLRRNDPIPVHRVAFWRSSVGGKVVTIVEKRIPIQKHIFHLSRTGLGAHDQQALIYDDCGEIYLLGREEQGEWRLTGQATLWME